MENNQINKPLSLLTKELEESLINTINMYTSTLHPSVIELIVNKVSMNVQQYAEKQTRNEQLAYEQSLAAQVIQPIEEELIEEVSKEDEV